ncbi:hypothetical protein B0J17DRAFT_706011 [Rhizoctonia solani]|nr:hypothetical protein B0J17DRAFT_706011 [Rhizoctonia solani]
MQTFARLLSVLTFLLSLGFIAQALPTTTPGAGLAVRQYNSPATSNSGYSKPSLGNGSGDEISAPSNGGKTLDIHALVVVDLKSKVDGHLAAIAEVKTVEEFKLKIDALIVILKDVIAVLVGAKINLDSDATVKLAVAISAIIIAIVKVTAVVVAKLGVSACVGILAHLDVTLHSLILVLSVCVNGFLAALIKCFVTINADVVAAFKLLGLHLLVKICAIAKVSLY